MPAAAPITNWGEALMTSLAAAVALLFSAVPRLIGFVLLIVVGWLIASALAAIVTAVLRAIRFNDLARSAGIAGFVDQMGLRTDASSLLAMIVKWFVRLIVLVVAFDELGLSSVSSILQSFVLWLPNLFVAAVILVVGGLLANLVARIVRGATATGEFGHPDFLAGLARAAVWGFAIIAAVNQIGVAAALVDALFFGFVAALALAFGLAFGLGGRDTAGQIVRDLYSRGRAAAPTADQGPYVTEREVPPAGTDIRAA